MSETHSFVKTFFSYQEASMFIERHMDDHDEENWNLFDLELKLLSGGGFRAGVAFRKREVHQMEETEVG